MHNFDTTPPKHWIIETMGLLPVNGIKNSGFPMAALRKKYSLSGGLNGLRGMYHITLLSHRKTCSSPSLLGGDRGEHMHRRGQEQLLKASLPNQQLQYAGPGRHGGRDFSVQHVAWPLADIYCLPSTDRKQISMSCLCHTMLY